jgi:glutathione S-transferase
MQAHAYVAIVSLLALLVYFWMGLRVGGARRKSGIAAPQMTGDPILERHIRVQANTLEWLPLFLPPLWLFALFWRTEDPTGAIAAAIGLVWIVGRILYALGYVADPAKREMGFLIQALATAVLLFGALGKAVWILLA